MLAFLLIENSSKALSSLPERPNSSLELIKVENMIIGSGPGQETTNKSSVES